MGWRQEKGERGVADRRGPGINLPSFFLADLFDSAINELRNPCNPRLVTERIATSLKMSGTIQLNAFITIK